MILTYSWVVFFNRKKILAKQIRDRAPINYINTSSTCGRLAQFREIDVLTAHDGAFKWKPLIGRSYVKVSKYLPDASPQLNKLRQTGPPGNKEIVSTVLQGSTWSLKISFDRIWKNSGSTWCKTAQNVPGHRPPLLAL